jgi:hypothetical protein
MEVRNEYIVMLLCNNYKFKNYTHNVQADSGANPASYPVGTVEFSWV